MKKSLERNIHTDEKISLSNSANVSSCDSKQQQKICGICGSAHITRSCDYVIISTHIPNEPTSTRARLSMPKDLLLHMLADGRTKVVTNRFIEKGTLFGPLEASKTITLNPSIQFPLKLFPINEEDYLEYYLDTTKEETSNWMIFVEAAENYEEQNLICYQEKQCIYYLSIKNINKNEALKVWYAPHYAIKMGKKLLERKSIEIVSQDIGALNDLVKSKQNTPDVDGWTCRFCYVAFNEVTIFAHHLIQDHYRAQNQKKISKCETTYESSRKLCHQLLKNQYKDEKLKKNKHVKISSGQCNNKEISIGGPLLNSMTLIENFDTSDLIMPTLCQLSEDNRNMGVENLNTETILLTENLRAIEYFNFEIEEDKEEEIICDICSKGFTTLSNLIQHLKGHRGDYYCASCNKVFSRKENLRHHSCNLNITYTCSSCNRTFSQKKYYKRHIDTVHNQKYKCHKCHKNYVNKYELNQHNCKMETNPHQTYACGICQKIFSQPRYLKKHIQRQHKNKNIFVCEICSKQYTTKFSYEVHSLIHREPQFKCEICHKEFYRKDTFKEHALNVHNNQELECDVCGKKFNSRKYLLHHKKIHEKLSHTCGICMASFQTKSNLTRHSKTHQKSMNVLDSKLIYQCKNCGKRFKLRSSLARHIHSKHSMPQEGINEGLTDKTVLQFLGEGLDLITDSQDNIDLINDTEMDELGKKQIQVIDNILLIKSEEMGLGINNYVLKSNESNSSTKLKEIGTSGNKKINNMKVLLSMPDLMGIESNIIMGTEEIVADSLTSNP